MEYYKPTTIFRQNAMKRMSSNPEIPRRKLSNESWLYHEQENKILNKTISSTKPQITSNYWKIPDDQLYLTSVSVNPENPEQLAIASGKSDSNLYIYNLQQEDEEQDSNLTLTYNQTITLPNIESLKWLNFDEDESTLLTGHKNGYVHMVSIPDVSNTDECAKIVKRFNHKKHFQNSNNRFKSLAVKQLLKSSWSSNDNNYISLCNENIFIWDLQHRSDLPILKNQTLGLLKIDACQTKNGILALAGEFGIAINDLRAPANTPSIFTPRTQANDSFNSIGSNNIKWAPYDSNILAASHLDGVIRLWDIRAQAYFGKLSGHNDLITTLEWSIESSSDLYSGGRDGNIIHWDLNFNEDLTDCCLNGGLDSVKYHQNNFLVDQRDIYQIVKKRQCGDLIPAAKNPIVEMVSCGDKILSIDGSSFLGVHNKNGVDAFKAEEGLASFIIDEILEEVKEEELEDTASEITLKLSSSPESLKTLVSSPPPSIKHKHQQSITNFQNTSDHSLNTLVDLEGEIQKFSSATRRISESTLNDDDNDEENLINDHFTYDRILPLNFKEIDQINESQLNAVQIVC